MTKELRHVRGTLHVVVDQTEGCVRLYFNERLLHTEWLDRYDETEVVREVENIKTYFCHHPYNPAHGMDANGKELIPPPAGHICSACLASTPYTENENLGYVLV